MNATEYKAKRDELLSVLDKIIQIDDIDKRYLLEFNNIRKKCLENQFNIALIGEFQGGKSTSFNTFCDGREISPRGALVKTSACILTAQNLSDPDQEEYALVTWKTDYELLIGFVDLIKDHILEIPKNKQRFTYLDDHEKEALMTSHEMAQSISLADRKDREMILQALEKEWNIYAKNKRDYNGEKLDLLYISFLVTLFYDDEHINSLKNNKRVSIDKIQKFITFPKDWNSRWGNGDAKAFRPEETVFAFIGSVTCMIHSKNLERLGCTVTDCPGLFASPWDTAVAENAMREADAILYLIGGGKAMQLQETKILKRIRQINMANKLFFAINMRVSKNIVKANIIPANVGTLNGSGFNIKASDIKTYHAFLAFAAAFGRLHLDKILDKRSEQSFLSLAQDMGDIAEQSVDKVWVRLVQQALSALGVSFDEIMKLGIVITEEYLCVVSRYSEMSGLMDDIEKHILDHKAYSILIPNGIDRAIDSLEKINADLKQKQDDAEQEKSQAEAEASHAEKNLEEFQKQAFEIIENSFEPSVYSLLIHNFYNNVLLGSIDMVSNDAGVQIVHKLRNRWDMLVGGIFAPAKRNQEIKEIVEAALKEAINRHVSALGESWIVNIKDGDESVRGDYDQSIIREITRINELLDKKWETLKTAKRLEGMDILLPSGNPLNDRSIFEAFQKSESPTGNIDDFWGPIGKGMVIDMLWNMVLVPFVQIFSLVNEGWKLIRDHFGNAEDVFQLGGREEGAMNKGEEEVKENISNHLNSFFNKKEEREKMDEEILQFLQGIGLQYQKTYSRILEEQKQTLQTSLRESRERFDLSFEKREKIAIAARELRTGKIEPVMTEVAAFKKTVVKLTGHVEN